MKNDALVERVAVNQGFPVPVGKVQARKGRRAEGQESDEFVPADEATESALNDGSGASPVGNGGGTPTQLTQAGPISGSAQTPGATTAEVKGSSEPAEDDAVLSWLLGGMGAVRVVASGGSSVNNLVTGSVTAGPVIASHGLSVAIFAADGSTLLGTGIVSASGLYSVNIGSYIGIVIARLVDASDGADYRDEATDTDKDVNAALTAAAVHGGGTLTLSITVVTTIAARKAGLAADGSGALSSAAAVTDANAAVASVFGLSDIIGVAPVPTNSGKYDPTNGLSAGETYGAILAALSGADQNHGGNSETVINALVEQITISGATGIISNPGKAVLNLGAVAADSDVSGDLISNTATLLRATAPISRFGSATDDVGSVTGILASSARTDDTALLLVGACEAKSTVNIYNGITLVGAATVSGTDWSYSATVANDTTYQFNVKETSEAGITGDATSDFTVTGDTTAPASATVAAVTTDDIINVAEKIVGVTISGTTDAGTSVTVNGSAATVTDTSWLASLDATAIIAFGQGTEMLTIVASDNAGNASVIGKTITVDTLAPTLAITSSASAVKAGETATITFTFSEATSNFDAGDIVTGGNGSLSNFAVVSSTEYTATFTPSANLASGNASITVASGNYTDAAGNTGGAGTTPAISIDTLAPTVIGTAITSATGIQNNTLTAGDVLSVTVTLSQTTNVTGVPNLALNIGGTTVQAAYASGHGSTTLVFTYTILTGETDADGISVDANSLALNGATLKDTAGNNATLTHTAIGNNSSYLVDTVTPTLDLAASSDTGSSDSDNITSDTTPTFTVTGAAGTTITLFKDLNSDGDVDGGESLGTVTLGGGVTSGSITSSALSANRYTNFKVIGSTGSASAAHDAITVDDAVAAPTLDLSSTSDTGHGTDDTTYDTTPTFAVTGERGATITLFNDADDDGVVDSGESLGTATLTNTTNGSVTPSAPLTGSTSGVAYTWIKVKQTDGAGNVSAASSAHSSITIKADGAVTVPTLDLADSSDTGSSNSDDITSDTTPTFTVTGASGSTLTLFNDADNDGVVDAGDSLGTVALGVGVSSGSITLATPLIEGTYAQIKVISSQSSNSVSGAHGPIFVNTATPTITNSVTDDFNDTEWDNWVRPTAYGNETMTGSTMQLTTATNNIKGGALYNTAFSSNQVMTFEFRYYAAEGSGGADGISFFLVDGTNTAFNLGHSASSLGYSYTSTTTTTGLDGGWLGAGLWEYPSWSSPFTGGSSHGAGIGLLGSESATTPYGYITSTFESNMGSHSIDGGYRRVKVTLEAAATNIVKVEWDRDDNGVYDYTPINNVDLDNYSTKVAARPETLKFGFAGSTGGSNNIHAIDWITVTTGTPAVAITSASGIQNSTLSAGDVVSVTVILSDPVTITGIPQLALNLGGTTVQADYASGSGTNELAFTYTILSGQADANGISIAANSLSLNGGTLASLAGSNATITHLAVADNSSYLVDAVAPSFSSATTANFAERNSGTAYDATADGDTGLTYALGGTDAARFSINVNTGAVTFGTSPNYELPTDSGGNNVYDITLNATDTAGNATSQAVAITVTDVIESGQAVIDLGTDGKLIAPVQIDENWYYYWDRSGDGTSNNAGSLNGGVDIVNHNVLDGIFRYASNFTTLDGDSDTDSTYRYATINGVQVALPTHGDAGGTVGLRNGTAIDNNPAGETNPTYDDQLAIWDGHDGTGTGTNTSGTPTDWSSLDSYWSSTTVAGSHAAVNLATGGVSSEVDTNVFYVALQVFPVL